MVELLKSLLEERKPGWDQKAIHEIIKLYGGTEKFVHHHLELLARADSIFGRTDRSPTGAAPSSSS